MAYTDKNIVITPNKGSSSADPKIVFSGASDTLGAQDITLNIYPTNSGTLSWEGSAGQLFSITNNLTSGSIFSVNDVSGIPSIDVDADGTIKLAPFGGNIILGSSSADTITANSDLNLDDGGTYSTTLQMVTATANRTISFPDASGTVALIAGSSGQLIYNSAGAQSGLTTSSIGSTGDITLSLAGAASTPPLKFTGSWFTGGTSTTTKPQVLIEPSGTTSTAWSTNGTGFGVNAASGFTGNLLDLQINGTRRMVVQGDGKVAIGNISATNLFDIRNSVAATDSLFGIGDSNLTRFIFGYSPGGISPTSNLAQIYTDNAGNININAGSNTNTFVRFATSSGSAAVEQFRITENRYIRLASGTGGIQFNGDTAAANALDDYEEGTWTPQLSVDNGSANITYNSRTGEYTKIGNVVYVSGELDVASYTLANTGQLEIVSLPFTVSNPTGKNRQFFQVTISGIDTSQGGFATLSPLNVVWGRVITSDILSPTTSSIGLYISADSGASNITPRILSGSYLTGHAPIIQFSGWYSI